MCKNQFISLFLIIYFGLNALLYAQNEHIRFQHLSVEDGLSQSTVTSILQDRQGFMWLATYHGLNRFDGYSFKTFLSNPKDSTTLSSNSIAYLFEDSRGKIWIGTEAGLNILDNSTGKFFRYFNDKNDPQSLSHNDVLSIIEDKEGNIWLASYGGGICRVIFDNPAYPDYNTLTFKRYVHNPDNPTSLNNNNVTAVFVDSQNRFWVGNDLGVSLFDPSSGKFTPVELKLNLTNYRRISIYEDSYKNIFIGTWGSGLFRITPDQTITQYIPGGSKPFGHNVVRVIFEDKDRELWVGTNGGGLHLYNRDEDTFRIYKNDPAEPNSLSNNSVISIYQDRSNILWLGTEFGGINKFDKNNQAFHHYKLDVNKNLGNNSNIITTIYEDQQDGNDQLWLGTWEGGLKQIDRKNKSVTHFLNKPEDARSLANNLIRSFAVDKNGIFWIGTNAGLASYDRDNDTFRNYHNNPSDKNSLTDDNVFSVYVDNENNVWVGTWFGGLDKFNRDTGDFTHYRHNPADTNSISDNGVWSILHDHNGYLWIGTDKGGLNRFTFPVKGVHNGLFKRFQYNKNDSTSLASNKVLTLFEDREGTLWVGTTRGLCRYNKTTGNFKIYSTKNGLPNSPVHSILQDNNGYLWISGNKGLSRFNPVNEEFKNYSQNNGLQSDEFGVNAAFKNKNGKLYFGGSNGYNAFYPEEIVDSTVQPYIAISDFQIFNNSVATGKEYDGHIILRERINYTKYIELPQSLNVFSFEYTLLDFSSTAHNQYAFKMEGFDPEWNYVGNRRFATYINMPAGNYTFKVKGANSRGIWNQEGTSIQIKIIPPFWKTDWFIFLSVLAIMIFIYLFYEYRVRLIKKRTVLLEKKVKERTSNLSETNTKLLSEIETRKMVEDQLLFAKETAEIANKSKSDFVSNISHEIRTPLNGVIGLTELMMETKLTIEQSNYVKMVKHSADQLLSIINDILDFSKIEAGHLELESIFFNLHEIVEDAGDILIYLIEKKNLNLNLYIADDVPEYLRGDPIRVRQILVNLISNAYKFTERGDITLTVELENRKNDNAVLRFAVSDTGPGISPGRFEAIFQSFTQADNSITRKFGGTGLGLPISKQLCEMMGGKIWVESPAVLNFSDDIQKQYMHQNTGGPGSTFVFTAKFYIQEPGRYKHDSVKSISEPMKILHINHHPINSLAINQMLEKWKNQVVTIQNPDRIYHHLENNRYEVIILDMETISGDLNTYIDNIRKYYNTPIIILTTISKEKELKDIKKSGNIQTINKPVKRSYLLDTLINIENPENGHIVSKKGKDSLDENINKLKQLAENVRILLVEDNHINQRVALALLNKTGIPVEVANDGLLAVEALKATMYDIVLMDIAMPNMDGLTATEKIRKELGLDIPIIAMTAQAMKGDSEKCFAAGMNDYIAKPISPGILFKSLVKWLTAEQKLKKAINNS